MTSLWVQLGYIRTLKTWHYPHLLLRAVLRPRAAAAPAVQRSSDTSYPPRPQQQTRRTLLQRANGTDRQTDGHRTVTYILLRANEMLESVAENVMTHQLRTDRNIKRRTTCKQP